VCFLHKNVCEYSSLVPGGADLWCGIMEERRVSANPAAQKEEKKEFDMNMTCLTTQDKLYRISVLREELRRLDAQLIRYRFCTSRFAQPEYYVEIVFENERAAALLGTDYPAAQILFDKLVCGLVTPCTLCDIMQDIKNDSNSLQT